LPRISARLRREGFSEADIAKVMGVDHVGLGADWDGGGGVIGMDDVAALPRISARLRREGFSEADIAKVMGGNLLRVMREVQAGAAPAR
jgi:membrane dipeptidase